MSWPNRKSVLVPIDFSDASFGALAEAVTLVAKATDVHAIHVLQSLETEADFLRAAFDGAERVSRAEAAIRERLTQAQREVGVIVRTGVAGDEIAATAKELGCDLIVIPSRGRSGLSRYLLGSVAERVLRRAACDVLVLHARGPDSE